MPSSRRSPSKQIDRISDLWREFEKSLESLPAERRGEELLRGIFFFEKQVAGISERDRAGCERYRLHVEQLMEFTRKREPLPK